jgi:NAD(P)H-hydrate repair Nnr-like enzyme with NAD(P)H-hydrate epimerase domain
MVIMIGQPALTREQMQAFDRWAIEELGVPGVVLMENAGRGCAEVLLRVHAASGEPSLPQSDSASDAPAPTAVLSRLEDFALGRYPRPHRVAVCCGRGNNGGDGYVLGRYLALLGIGVQVLAFADPEQLSGRGTLGGGAVLPIATAVGAVLEWAARRNPPSDGTGPC